MLTGSGAGRRTINFSERRAVALALSLDTVPSQSPWPILLGKAARPTQGSSMSRSFRAAQAFCPVRFLDNLPRTLMKRI